MNEKLIATIRDDIRQEVSFADADCKISGNLDDASYYDGLGLALQFADDIFTKVLSQTDEQLDKRMFLLGVKDALLGYLENLDEVME